MYVCRIERTVFNIFDAAIIHSNANIRIYAQTIIIIIIIICMQTHIYACKFMLSEASFLVIEVCFLC
jgi:hypothetical protein